MSGFFVVELEGQVLTCKARGKLRLGQSSPMAGDRVQVTPGEGPEDVATLDRILPRQNMLYRPPVANIDLVLLVLATASPEPDLLLIDKLLALTAHLGIGAAVCINKYDLAPGRGDELKAVYSPLGLDVLCCSAQTGYGLGQLQKLISSKTAVMAGQSGVGKSRLARFLTGDLNLEVGELSTRLARGKHTTRQVRLLPTPGWGRLADTPGFSAFSLEGLESRNLTRLYPDFASARCRFSNCQHLEEPGCSVRKLLETGGISPGRYDNYLKIHQHLREKEADRY